MIKVNNFKTYDDQNNTVIHDSDTGERNVSIYNDENNIIKTYQLYPTESGKYGDEIHTVNTSYENNNTKIIKRDKNNDLISVQETFKNEKGNEVERYVLYVEEADDNEAIYRTDTEHYPVENIQIQKYIQNEQYYLNDNSNGNFQTTTYNIDEKNMKITISQEDLERCDDEIFIERKTEDNRKIVIKLKGDEYVKNIYDENDNIILSNTSRLSFTQMYQYNENNKLIKTESHRLSDFKHIPDETTFTSGQDIHYDLDDKNRIVRQEIAVYSQSDEDKNIWLENNDGGLFKQFISKYQI